MTLPKDSSRSYRPPGVARAVATSARSDQGDQAAHPDEEAIRRLIRELQTLTTDSLERTLGKLFVGADDVLFEKARKAGNNREQAVYLDAMRSVRLGRAWIQQRFLEEIGRSFDPRNARKQKDVSAPANADLMELADSSDIEKSIAIQNIANRANELYKQSLWDLSRRLGTLINRYAAPIPPLVFAPISFCEAFRMAVDTQKLEVPIAVVLYQLFDRVVISELAGLYKALIRIFERYSIQPEKVSLSNPSSNEPSPSTARFRTPEAPAAEPSSPGRNESLHYSPRYSAVPGPGIAQASAGYRADAISPDFLPSQDVLQPPESAATSASMRPGVATVQMLRQLRQGLASSPSPQLYSDQRLADDLICAALDRIVPGWEPAHARAYVCRTDAVGQMFNGIMDDPDMPEELKPRFDELRFSVVKTALQDINFFANPQHAVRGLVNELATLAASARATSMDMLSRIEDLVGRIQDQFQVAAESVRNPKVDPLEHIEVERFLADQIEKNRQRRKAVVEKAKRVVEEELQLRCKRHQVPATALTLLRSGWAPMMAAHLLRAGINSDPWRDGIQLLERILTALDPVTAATAGGPAQLVASIDQQLASAGMIGTRRKELLDAFLPSLLQAEMKRRGAGMAARQAAPAPAVADLPTPVAAVAAPAEQAVSIEALFEALIRPGSWFRILDARTGQNRWMRAVTYYPGRGNVAFAEFNGRNSLFIDRAQFLDGLLRKKIEPLELLPMARDVLDRYIAQSKATQGQVGIA